MKFFFFIVFIKILLGISASKEKKASVKNAAEHLLSVDDPHWDDHLLPQDYDGHKLKTCNGEKVPKINISLFPLAIGEISLKRMTFEVQLAVLTQWIDCRISLPDKFSRIYSKTVIENLWTPEMEFHNCMKCDVIHFDPHKDKLGIFKSHFYFLTIRTAKVLCTFNLRAYPLEMEYCTVEVALKLPDSFVKFHLQDGENIHHLSTDISPQDFIIKEIGFKECKKSKKSRIEYSCAALIFHMQRQSTYYFINTYIPSLFLVMLSWISFWLDIEAAAPRVAIGLTTFLALITQYISIQKDLPPVSYIKAIEIWMFACISWVFASLLEFAFANYFKKVKNKAPILPKSVSAPVSNKVYVFKNPNLNKLIKSEKIPADSNVEKIKRNVQLIDKISRFLFPAAFALFNVIYWLYYLNNNNSK